MGGRGSESGSSGGVDYFRGEKAVASLKNQIPKQSALPGLEGSAKQVAWAEKIREKKIETAKVDINNLADDVRKLDLARKDAKSKNPKYSPNQDSAKAQYERGKKVVQNKAKNIKSNINNLKNQTSASFWIDNR